MKHPSRRGILFASLIAVSALLLAGTIMGTMTASAKSMRSSTMVNSIQIRIVDSASSLDTGPSNPTAFTVVGKPDCSQGIGGSGPWACRGTVYCYFDYGVPGAHQYVLHSKTPYSFLEDANLTEDQAAAAAKSHAPSVPCVPTRIRAPHLPR